MTPIDADWVNDYTVKNCGLGETQRGYTIVIYPLWAKRDAKYNKMPTNMVVQAKRQDTKIRPKAVGSAMSCSAVLSNFSKCQSEAVGDVIPGVVVD